MRCHEEPRPVEQHDAHHRERAEHKRSSRQRDQMVDSTTSITSALGVRCAYSIEEERHGAPVALRAFLARRVKHVPEDRTGEQRTPMRCIGTNATERGSGAHRPALGSSHDPRTGHGTIAATPLRGYRAGADVEGRPPTSRLPHRCCKRPQPRQRPQQAPVAPGAPGRRPAGSGRSARRPAASSHTCMLRRLRSDPERCITRPATSQHARSPNRRGRYYRWYDSPPGAPARPR